MGDKDAETIIEELKETLKDCPASEMDHGYLDLNGTLEFWVYGEPVPKGSTKSFYIKKIGRTVTTDSNPETKKWQARIAEEAQKAQDVAHMFSTEKNVGYVVECWFYTQKPKSKPKWWRFWTTRPDIDKLARAVLDGLTGVIIADDSQVIDLLSHKRYCASPHDPPGAKIRIYKAI